MSTTQITTNSPNNLRQLKARAVEAAKNGDWPKAQAINTELLESAPHDVNTLNRLGVALSQLGQKKKALASFEQVLKIDRHNLIASKHAQKLKNNNHLHAPTFTNQQFIEEPGKTKVVELHRLAGKHVLESLSVGQACDLIRKKRYISVEAKKQYVGALPEDVSFRLCKLISLGNKYDCFIRSTNSCSCSVYIKETHRSKRNQHVHSFPPGKFVLKMEDIIDETALLDDDDRPKAKEPATDTEDELTTKDD